MVYHGKKSYGRLNFNDVEKEILIKKKKKEKNNTNHIIYIEYMSFFWLNSLTKQVVKQGNRFSTQFKR